MRDATAWPHPTLARELCLPASPDDGNQATNGAAVLEQLFHSWSQFIGERQLLFAPNLREARRWLVKGLQVGAREPVMLPPNATHDLVETIKQAGASVRFGSLDSDLCLEDGVCPEDKVAHRLVWLQPPFGLPARSAMQASITVVEHGDTVPGGELCATLLREAQVAVFGLHLSADATESGALLVFSDTPLYRRVKAYCGGIDARLMSRAIRQLARLRTLAPQRQEALDTVATGLHEAAGLALLRPCASGVLAHGIAVRLPAECSPALFWHYAQGENTPVLWLPQERPIHYAAVTVAGSSAAHLERWLVVPVSAQNDLEANKQTVLGIVKAAEYLGVRWRSDPARAARYAALLVEKYGPNHDAYRPVFATSGTPERLYASPDDIRTDDLFAPACRLPL